MLFGQWSWRPCCEALRTMEAGCELARREATEATVAGMTPAQALAWSCWKMKGRWPLKASSNREVKAMPGFSRYLTTENKSRGEYSISENSVTINPEMVMHKVSLKMRFLECAVTICDNILFISSHFV